MNRNRMLAGLAFAVVCALILAIFVFREFKQATAPRPVPKMGQIVVAVGALPLGTRLEAKDLRLMPWPEDAPVEGMFTRLEDCENRALITSVAENEPILQAKLAPKEAGAGLAATIPEGMRAMSAAVNDVVAVAGFVTPGAMVDVLATGASTSNGGVTRTVLENVRVLAANQRIESRNGKPETFAVITLLVTPADAAKLAMASNAGKIQLALRNTLDSQTVSPPPVLQASIFGVDAPPQVERHVSAASKPVAPPPPPGYDVEVIQGSKRETKTFQNPAQAAGESNGQPTQNR
ncbi:MAG: Flp pilus assembly protein CpaB [Candidatus Acidiferrales bacterium]|jgi:pilus assembly protein CpaB